MNTGQIGIEFEQLQPAVPAVSVPAAPYRLCVEKNLVDRFARVVRIDPESGTRVHVVGFGNVAAKNHADIRRGLDQLFPDLLPGIAGIAENVGLARSVFKISVVTEQVRVRRHNPKMVPVFRTGEKLFRPFNDLVAGNKFQGNRQNLFAAGRGPLVGGILQRVNTERVRRRFDKNPLERGVPADREIFREVGVARFRRTNPPCRFIQVHLRPVIVVAGAENVGINPVEPFKAARGRTPHLPSVLVRERSVGFL